jgi:alkanesulfonate monooxygenase SsuD/methylene tetrahydromethanopterin reductase-like flavin-dependent oxidoreductase (luciferase family)
MIVPKQIRLNLNLQTAGRHDAAWKRQEETDRLASDADWYVDVAQLAEKGKFDTIFLADSHGSLLGESTRRPWRGLEPTVLLFAIARETNRIGLVSTVHAIYGHPFSVARSIASLDHVSKGRGAWNIITCQTPPTLEALGRGDRLDNDTRYRKADEFVEIVTELWDSLPQSAIVDDHEHDLCIDIAKTAPVDFEGRFYSTKAVLPLPGGYAGRPVLFQAGASDHSRAFGAKWADALFVGQRTKDLAQRFSSHAKGLAAANTEVPRLLRPLRGGRRRVPARTGAPGGHRPHHAVQPGGSRSRRGGPRVGADRYRGRAGAGMEARLRSSLQGVTGVCPSDHVS